MVNPKIYVEGGGDNKKTRSACRKGFISFVERAGLQGKMPKVIPCGDRGNAYIKFKTACELDEFAMLLLDAEGSITAEQPWDHLSKQDTWPRPEGATSEQCHLMVQVMESWFLADKKTLREYYRKGFNINALPKNPNIENIPKEDVIKGLNNATKNTQKGKYNKGSHSFEILARLDPEKVRRASQYADRFIKTLLGQSDD